MTSNVHMKNDEPMLPLRYWGITVGLVVLLISVVSVWQLQQDVEVTPAAYYAIDRLEPTSDRLKVVAVGASILRFAFPFDHLTEQQALARGLPIDFTRLTKNVGTEKEFSVLFSPILVAKPDWVFLDAECFTIYWPKTEPNWLTPFRQAVRTLKKTNENGLYMENSQEASIYTRDELKQIDLIKQGERWRKLLGKRLALREPIFTERFIEFLKLAKSQRTRVVMLDIGRSKLLNDKQSPEFHRQLTANLAYLAHRYPLEVWRFPANLPPTHYTDHAHLNPKGKQVFWDWFFDRFKNKVKKND